MNRESVQETLQLLDQEVLDHAAGFLIRARRICIYGLSINYYMGELFQHK